MWSKAQSPERPQMVEGGIQARLQRIRDVSPGRAPWIVFYRKAQMTPIHQSHRTTQNAPWEADLND